MNRENTLTERRLAVHGGAPLSEKVLGIVRPKLPPLERFADRLRVGMEKGQVTNNGPAVIEFEQKIATYCGAPAVLTNNGQSALMIMLRAAGIESGEVIVPSYTFSATPHAVRWVGAKPIFADMKNMVIDPEDVERRVTSRTVAILGVDVYGLACDYDALERLGNKHGIKVLFDSAPSFGTRVGGKVVGARGDAQIFSFHATKAFNTMEGGAVVSKNSELITRAKALRNFGQIRGADCDEPGINAKMMEISALIGIEQLKDFDEVVAHRFASTEIMRQELEGIPGLSLTPVPAGQMPVWLYFPVVVDPLTFGMGRDVLAQALERENIHVRRYFELPCHHLSCYAEQKHVSLAETQRVAYNVVALPVYNDMKPDECKLIAQAIREIHLQADRVRQVLA